MSTIYSIQFDEKKCMTLEGLMSLEYNLSKNFHNCEALLSRKKELEKMIKRCKNKNLKNHFRCPFTKRKESFYRKIVYDILDISEPTELENNIIELTKDILFIYSEKMDAKSRLDCMIEYTTSVMDHEQEMRESLVEEWRGID